MAGRIIYLDVDDEITSAAARIRDADGPRVALVLPYGSRIATSRINFRLLSREALINEKRLSIVAADAATRALAASAGLPVFGSVAEYEAAERGLDEADAGGRRARLAAPVDGRRGRHRRGAADGAAAPRTRRHPTAMPRRPSRSPSSRTRPDAATRGREPDGTLGLVVPAVAAGAAAGAAGGAIGTVGSASADRRPALLARRRPDVAGPRRAGPSPERRDRTPRPRRPRRPGRSASARSAGSGRPGSSAARSSSSPCSSVASACTSSCRPRRSSSRRDPSRSPRSS